jgi:hypothetical protein
MDSYNYFSATGNFPSKSFDLHHIQPQVQYFQPPATQEMNPFDVNAFAALSPSSVGSLTITPSLISSTVPLPTESPENAYMRLSRPSLPPPTPSEGPPTHPQVAPPAVVPANRGVRRRRQQEVEELAEGDSPAPKRRRREHRNSSMALAPTPTVPGVLSTTPAVTSQSLDVEIPPVDEQAISWAPSARKRRSVKKPEEAPSASTRETANHSVIRAPSAPLPDTKYGWLDHLLSSALESNKRP